MVENIINLFLRHPNEYPYFKFFKFYTDRQKFLNVNNKVIKRIAQIYTKHQLYLAMEAIKKHEMEEVLIYYKQNLSKVIIMQRACRKWYIRHKLWKEIGPNAWKLFKRRNLNNRVVVDGILSLESCSIKLSPFNRTPAARIDENLRVIDKKILKDNWKLFWDKKPLTIDTSFVGKIYRTVINHAKWCAGILDLDLYWTIAGSSFLLLEYDKTQGLMKEINGFYLRSLYRRLISNAYEPLVHDVEFSSRPIIAHGGLYSNIVRGLHSNKLDLLKQHSKDQLTGEELQSLFWVKWGKKSKYGKSVLKHVMWVRGGESYRFKVFVRDRGYQPKQTVRIPTTFRIKDVDHNFKQWMTDLYDKTLIDLSFD
jgi:hypothetical protein